MTKAFLMNSTRYLTGSGGADTLWSTGQGMGALNLGTAFDGVPRLLRDQVAADVFTASGQTRVYRAQISDATKPVRVTLAWTDAVGSTTGAAYNNDLDLTVTVGGNTYKGNVFSGALSVTGGTVDARNNVESVFLNSGFSGDIIVIVTAANVASVSVPNAANAPQQDFALVAYNAATAITAPSITGIHVSGTAVNVSLEAVAGVSYTLEYKDSLSTATWVSLATQTPTVSGTLVLTDSIGTQTGRFYRVRAE